MTCIAVAAMAMIALSGCGRDTAAPASVLEATTRPTATSTAPATTALAEPAANPAATPVAPSPVTASPVTASPVPPSPGATDSNAASRSQNIELITRTELEHRTSGLDEPSGLAIPSGTRASPTALWSVSDSTGALFELDLSGQSVRRIDIDGLEKSLEGIAVGDDHAWVVHEDDNEVAHVDLDSRRVVARAPLDQLAGYSTVADLVRAGGDNKGLEGVVLASDTGDGAGTARAADADRLFVLKEGQPGVLIELSTDLASVIDHRVLDPQAGFSDPGTSRVDLDFSGLAHDPATGLFWIVSDRGQRIFVYDWDTDQVITTHAIDEAVKPEGIALDPERRLIYVVSEAAIELLTYEVSDVED